MNYRQDEAQMPVLVDHSIVVRSLVHWCIAMLSNTDLHIVFESIEGR